MKYRIIAPILFILGLVLVYFLSEGTPDTPPVQQRTPSAPVDDGAARNLKIP